MKSPPHIVEKEKLAQYQQISTFVYHVLTVAQAGGMKEKRAKKIYHEILGAYSTLKGDAFWLFRDEIAKILVTPDSQFEKSAGEGMSDFGPPGRN